MSKQAQDQTSRNLLRAEVERDYKNAKPEQQHTPGPSWIISKIGNPYDEYSIYAGNERIATAIPGKANAELIAAAPETAAERDRLKEATKALLAIHDKLQRNEQVQEPEIRAAQAQARAAIKGETSCD